MPVATGRYGDLSVFSLKIDQNGREEPSADVRIMRLDPTTSLPQVILEYFWGGAHCCTITKIATVDSSRNWRVVDGEVLDGGGYRFEDLDGNGGNELVSVDNSFLYAFACYACSYAPTRIHKLVRSELSDVTRNPLYQNFLRQRLRAMETDALQSSEDQLHSNGYLAGWVAAKSLVGDFQQAWRTMLTAYDRNSDWVLEECLTGVRIDKCPEDKKRRMEFPEALAKHLVDNGYITAEQKQRLVMTSNEQPQVRPWGKASLLEVCGGSGDTVRDLVLSSIVGRRDTMNLLGNFITLHDDFTVSANNTTINKVTCAVSYEADLRGIVGKLAENGQMQTAMIISNVIRRQGPTLSRRVNYTVQPTSKVGQTWIQLLP